MSPAPLVMDVETGVDDTVAPIVTAPSPPAAVAPAVARS
jgi:hypothetical protein